MSEVVTVVKDGGWERLYRTLKEKLFDCTEEVLSSMADFQKELVKHLNEMTELNSEIARMNADLAMKLSGFERDICHIRDYYDRIISSTKTVVNYGSNQKLIPYIKDLIEEKRYIEAEAEIKSLLYFLKKLIKRIERDIEAMHKDCPAVETMKDQIKESILASDPTKVKQNEIKANHGRVFRLGTSTLVYTMAAGAAGLVITSCMSQESTELAQIVTSAGSEVFSFWTGSVLKGLGSVMETTNLSIELRKKVESSVVEVCRCLTGFFKQLNHFQSDIKTIETTIDGLKLDIADLQDEVDSGATLSAGWMYMREILQKMFENFTHLSKRVIEKPTEGFNKEAFNAALERLHRSIELTTLGSPV